MNDDRRRPLTPRARVALLLGSGGVLILVTWLVPELLRQRAERAERQRKTDATRECLTGFARVFRGRKLPRAGSLRELAKDWIGSSRIPGETELQNTVRLSWVRLVLFGSIEEANADRPYVPGGMFEITFDASERDGWGQLFVYQCPGRVHPTGWDLYSIGPDGFDACGGGDDILVGED